MDRPGLTVLRGFTDLFHGLADLAGFGKETLVEVVIASDRVMDRVHRDTMGIAGTTDCIAIPTGFGDLGATGPERFAGAFYLGVDEARRNARSLGHGVDREVAFVLAHGLLHLTGWEDGDEAARTRMFAHQEELIRGAVRRLGRLPRLVRFPSGARP